MFHDAQFQRNPPFEGRIMMLPRRDTITEILPTALNIDIGIFNHPVIVISKLVYQETVAVVVVRYPALYCPYPLHLSC
jgi:hypothetical protein